MQFRHYLSCGLGISIPREVKSYEWVVVSRRRYRTDSLTRNNVNAIVAVLSGCSDYKVGRLISIVEIEFPVSSKLPILSFGVVQYLVPQDLALDPGSTWHSV
jgi:hypothetical protein